MKIYCLYDRVRRKYFRSVFDGRKEFTTKPYQLTSDLQRLGKLADRLNNPAEWKRSHEGPTPELIAEEFELDCSPEPSYAKH